MSFIEKYNDGTWHIESLLGEGSFGKVYKVFKEDYGRKYYSALKVIPVPQSSSEISQLKAEGLKGESLTTYIGELVQDIMSEINFVEEFKGTANIVGYEDHQIIEKEDDTGVYILIRMELLQSLEKVAGEKKLGEEEAAKIGIDICHALELLARGGTIHRDIKPDNILLSKYGDYKLGDFGIARRIDHTSGMSKKGTYSYMAPEVFMGHEYGMSVDLYSLGLVLYRILNNGRMPFLPASTAKLSPGDREDALSKRMKGEPLPAPANASPEFAEIILKACAYNREDRFKTATEMRKALEDLKLSGLAESSDAKAPQINDNDKLAMSFSASSSRKPNGRAEPVVATHSNPVISKTDDKNAPVITPLKDSAAGDQSGKAKKKIPIGVTVGALAGCIAIIALIIFMMPRLTQVDDTHEVVMVSVKEQTFQSDVTALDLSNQKLRNEDLAELSNLTDIKELNASSNYLFDASSFSMLKTLEKIDVSKNLIQDISALSGMDPLYLYLSDNEITDISVLGGLANLKLINLSNNQVTDITGLAGLTNLSYLNLRNNPVSQKQIDNLKSILKDCDIVF
ncbi:MAG: protein kinase [Clostridiales bacterium]|nr:protein kinase [Clostridiales bacterium]